MLWRLTSCPYALNGSQVLSSPGKCGSEKSVAASTANSSCWYCFCSRLSTEAASHLWCWHNTRDSCAYHRLVELLFIAEISKNSFPLMLANLCYYHFPLK